ncbi:uncharacterized protein [Physcomitrium patens]|uniref:uncharacterized protein isoform X4 n=1 Tax=Physcomitrium patens TaxID=3218 RepID=UPI003CCD7265
MGNSNCSYLWTHSLLSVVDAEAFILCLCVPFSVPLRGHGDFLPLKGLQNWPLHRPGVHCLRKCHQKIQPAFIFEPLAAL